MKFFNSCFKIRGVVQNVDRTILKIYRRNLETIVEKATGNDLNRVVFIEDVFKNVKNYVKVDENVRNVVVEFSSPNIAKPFHIGHLRSTIVGNFVANLLEKYAACHVTRLNYLGDWGIQFGLLKIGLDYLRNNESSLVSKELSKNVIDKSNPIKLLYEAYVAANKLAESDDTVLKKAQTIFQLMENGSDDVLLNDWKELQKITVDYLKETYLRLGIVFDCYDFESFYSSNRIGDLISQLRMILVEGQKMNLDDKEVIVIKSDNTTLYLTRDLAAALDRYRRFQFDRMLYVVGDQQIFHFKSLFHLMSLMKIDWTDKLQHIRFGNISGMSTRKGNAVFLSDILDELSERMYQKQISTKTTKVENTDKKTADILAVSCMIINDLKHRRKKCFNFDWDKALDIRGDSGVRLQYTHCRLCSILRNSNNKIATEVQPMFFLNSVHNQDIMNLIDCIAQFPNVLKTCYDDFESYHLVKYLFRICNRVNQVVNELRVNELQEDDARQALLLFETSRFVIQNSMEILGLPVLEKM